MRARVALALALCCAAAAAAALSPPPTRLLARKCCAAWEQLAAAAPAPASADGSWTRAFACGPREGSSVRRGRWESLAAAEARGALHWLPAALRGALGDAAAWHVEYAAAVACAPRDRLEIASRETHRYRLEANGSLLLHSRTALGGNSTRRFAPEDFCMDALEEAEAGAGAGAEEAGFLLRLCPCGPALACARKCCPLGMAMRVGRRLTCELSPFDAWLPNATSSASDAPPDVALEVLEARPPRCTSAAVVKDPRSQPAHVLDAWFALTDGRVFQQDAETCGDTTLPWGTPSVALCGRPLPFAAYAEAGGGAHAAAAALLLLVLCAQAALPQLRAGTHGRALASHALAQLAANALLAARLASRGRLLSCAWLPFVLHFCMVSSGFWLNVIAINMALAFRRPEQVAVTPCPRRARRFLWASLYAWGCAAALSGATAAAWLAPRLPPAFPRPTLHETRVCFHEISSATKWGTFVYYFGPMAALLAANLGLVLYTALRIRGLHKLTAMLNKDSYALSRPSRSAVLYVKLLLALGVAELAAELAAWAAGDAAAERAYVGVADALDLARAVCAFALCVCRPRVLRALAARVSSCFGRCGGGGAAVACCGAKGVSMEDAACESPRTTAY